jgi:hypothetical protein
VRVEIQRPVRCAGIGGSLQKSWAREKLRDHVMSAAAKVSILNPSPVKTKQAGADRALAAAVRLGA